MPRDAAPNSLGPQCVYVLQTTSGECAQLRSAHDGVIRGTFRVRESEPREFAFSRDGALVWIVTGETGVQIVHQGIGDDPACRFVYRKPPEVPRPSLDLVELDPPIGGTTESDRESHEQDAHPYSLHGIPRAGNGANLEQR